MKKKTLKEINEIYEINIDEIVKVVKKKNAKNVLLQFPEGLKPYSMVIVDELKEKCDSEFIIWMDSCFGACDLPIESERIGVDLIIQFGHSKWGYKDKNIKEIK